VGLAPRKSREPFRVVYHDRDGKGLLEIGAIQHLARAVFFSRWKESRIALFRAYFDASGKKEHRVMTVAGFVSRPEKWDHFQEAWMKLLPLGMKMFHMTDFVSFQNGWEEWRGDDNRQRRIKLITDLVDCVKRHTNKGFAQSVRLSDFRRASKRFEIERQFNHPYVLLGMGCLGGIKRWAEKKNEKVNNILCLFEDGDEGQGDLIAKARREGFNAIPQSKAEIRAFDAADLAAWKARAVVDDAWERQLFRKDEKAAPRIERSLDQIDKLINSASDNAMYSQAAIERVLIGLSVPKRLL
jgi:hypothetical protein